MENAPCVPSLASYAEWETSPTHPWLRWYFLPAGAFGAENFLLGTSRSSRSDRSGTWTRPTAARVEVSLALKRLGPPGDYGASIGALPRGLDGFRPRTGTAPGLRRATGATPAQSPDLNPRNRAASTRQWSVRRFIHPNWTRHSSSSCPGRPSRAFSNSRHDPIEQFHASRRGCWIEISYPRCILTILYVVCDFAHQFKREWEV